MNLPHAPEERRPAAKRRVDLAELGEEAEALDGDTEPRGRGAAIERERARILAGTQRRSNGRREDAAGAAPEQTPRPPIAVPAPGHGLIEQTDGHVDADHGRVRREVQDVGEALHHLHRGLATGEHDDPAGPTAVGTGG